jgi:hypothetical protein
LIIEARMGQERSAISLVGGVIGRMATAGRDPPYEVGSAQNEQARAFAIRYPCAFFKENANDPSG